MSVLNREQFFESVKSIISGNNSEDSTKFLEDMTDTYNDIINRTQNDDWKKKYKELDKIWTERYKNRFFNNPVTSIPDLQKTQPDTKPNNDFNNLFKED